MGVNKIDEKIKAKEQRKKSSFSNIVEAKKESEPIKQIDTFLEIKAKRDKRVNYVITENTYSKLQKKSKKLGMSVNEIVNQLLDNFVSDM